VIVRDLARFWWNSFLNDAQIRTPQQVPAIANSTPLVVLCSLDVGDHSRGTVRITYQVSAALAANRRNRSLAAAFGASPLTQRDGTSRSGGRGARGSDPMSAQRFARSLPSSSEHWCSVPSRRERPRGSPRRRPTPPAFVTITATKVTRPRTPHPTRRSQVGRSPGKLGSTSETWHEWARNRGECHCTALPPKHDAIASQSDPSCWQERTSWRPIRCFLPASTIEAEGNRIVLDRKNGGIGDQSYRFWRDANPRDSMLPKCGRRSSEKPHRGGSQKEPGSSSRCWAAAS